ncbi:hypothetical protein KSS87_011767 [Heliosperma pusillum]|nr:hypothetical protein KSS87_011767 [Heliosperma pusillum]
MVQSSGDGFRWWGWFGPFRMLGKRELGVGGSDGRGHRAIKGVGNVVEGGGRESLVPEIGVYDGEQNFSAESEDDGRIINVGEPGGAENEPSINKHDDAPQLDQDSMPSQQKDCTNMSQFGKCNERIPLFGECNSDPAQAEGCTTAFSSPKRARRTLNRRAPLIEDSADSALPLPSINERSSYPTQAEGYTIALPTAQKTTLDGKSKLQLMNLSIRDTALCSYGREPLIEDISADSAQPGRPLPSLNDETYGGGINTSGSGSGRGGSGSGRGGRGGGFRVQQHDDVRGDEVGHDTSKPVSAEPDGSSTPSTPVSPSLNNEPLGRGHRTKFPSRSLRDFITDLPSDEDDEAGSPSSISNLDVSSPLSGVPNKVTCQYSRLQVVSLQSSLKVL